MPASQVTPYYKAAIIVASGKRVNVTQAITSLNYGSTENEIATKATISMANVKCDGVLLTSLLKPRNRIFIYANTGEGDKEVFRGYLWNKKYTSKLEKTLTYVCYDNLIYLQESSDALYFSAGHSTISVFSEICKKWGVPLKYSYESITHSKLPLRGNLSDIFRTDLLTPVRKQTGKRFVIRSKEDTMYVEAAGSNSTIYQIKRLGNALDTATEETMSGMTTQVIITGKADDDGRTPVKVKYSRNTDKYGTLQKVLSSSDDDSLADAKKEAEKTLNEKSTPEWSGHIEAVDNPWVRKGDKVEISAGDLVGKYIVLGITHDCVSKTMGLELTKT